jgi:hypothetical protein
MAIVVAVCYYLFHAPDWLTFRLVPIAITLGFVFSVVNDVRKMRSAA